MNVNRGRRAAFAPAPQRSAWRAAALVALAGALITGCGNVCDDAADHEKECGYDDNDRYGGASCDGSIECTSQCFTKAPCGAFDGTDTHARDVYRECLKGC